MTHAVNVWNKFCQRFKVVEQSVPLFTTDADRVVAHRMLGRTSRPILMRSPEMEALDVAWLTGAVGEIVVWVAAGEIDGGEAEKVFPPQDGQTRMVAMSEAPHPAQNEFAM